MKVRAKSRSCQWTVWLCAALVLLAVYVLLSRVFFDSVTWDLFDPRLHRLAIPLVAFFFYVAWNTRWDGVRREKKVREKVRVEDQDEVEKVGGGGQRKVASDSTAQLGRAPTPTAPQSHNDEIALKRDCGGSEVSALRLNSEKNDHHCPPPPHSSTSPTQLSVESATGEDLFNQARALPHQIVPDFVRDGPYLDLLGKSAAKGYPPALAKLGEYAMRRGAWVEAYYWMSMAKRQGMQGLTTVMRGIRKNWSQDGFPEQLSNVNELFTVEASSIGRALLHVDSGHEAGMAKEFLRANHPDYICTPSVIGCYLV